MRAASDTSGGASTRGRRTATRGTAPWSHRQWTPLAHALAAVGDRWTLLIVLALARGKTRLAELKERLPGISSAVLDSHVQRLADLGLITRERFREMPPRVELSLTDAGDELVAFAEALARWGMSHTWSAPAPGERVDVAVLLDMLPALLDEAEGLPDGTVSLVLRRSGSSRTEVMTMRAGRARLLSEPEAGEARRPDARISGDEAAWVAALGPGRDCDALSCTGDRAMADRVLRALPHAA